MLYTKQPLKANFNSNFINDLIQEGKPLSDLDIVVFVSIQGNSGYEPDFFYPIPLETCKTFKSITFVIGDTTQIPNIESRNIIQGKKYTPAECEQEAIKLGKTWLKKNRNAFKAAIKFKCKKLPTESEIDTSEKLIAYIQKLKEAGKINFEILTFDQWAALVEQTENFERRNQEYLSKFDNPNCEIYKKWRESSKTYTAKYLKTHKKISSSLSEKDVESTITTFSEKYVKNEAFHVVYGAGALHKNIAIYQGDLLPVFQEIRNEFVINTFKDQYGWDKINVAPESPENENQNENENVQEDASNTVMQDMFQKFMEQQRQQASNLVNENLHPKNIEKPEPINNNPPNVNGQYLEILKLLMTQQQQQESKQAMQQTFKKQNENENDTSETWTQADKHWVPEQKVTPFFNNFSFKATVTIKVNDAPPEKITFEISCSTSPPKA